MKTAFEMVQAERERQDKKWGIQNHPNEFWHLILQEELGEVAKAQLENNAKDFRNELVQVCAVAMAWLECELRSVYLGEGKHEDQSG